MNREQQQVLEFMRAAGQPTRDQPGETLSEELRLFRQKLIAEEYLELLDSLDGVTEDAVLHEERNIHGYTVGIDARVSDVVQVADAIGDLFYVLYGLACSLGIDMEPVFAEIHRSNAAKLIDGKIVYRKDGKILKPEGWTPPDLHSVIEKQMGE